MDPVSITAATIGITEAALSSISHLRDFISSLAEAREAVQDIASTLEAIQRPLDALKQLQISDSATYAEAKTDLEKTGLAKAVNDCGQACDNFSKRLKKWTKHSSDSRLSLRDRLSVGVWNKEKIRTFRTQVQSCQAIVQFAIESTQLLIQLRSECTSKTDRAEHRSRLQHLEQTIQDHIDLIKRQRNEIQNRKQNLENDMEEDSAEQTLTAAEVEAQERFLEAEQAASKFISSRVQSRLSDKDSGNTYSTVFLENVNTGMQIGYSAGTINWNTSR